MAGVRGVVFWPKGNLARPCVDRAGMRGGGEREVFGPALLRNPCRAPGRGALLPQAWQILGFNLKSRLSRLCAAGSVPVLAVIVSWIAIWACYGFRYSISPDPSLHFDRAKLVQLLQEREEFSRHYVRGAGDDSLGQPNPPSTPPSLPVRGLLWLDDHHLLPGAWTIGLLHTYQSTLMRGTFLMNKVSIIGQWYYFPCAMLFKTPLAVLALALILPLQLLFRRSKSEAPKSEMLWTMLCLWVPIAIYGTSAMTSNLAIGLRHVLPLYPLIDVLMAAALCDGSARATALRSRARPRSSWA